MMTVMTVMSSVMIAMSFVKIKLLSVTPLVTPAMILMMTETPSMTYVRLYVATVMP
jgi:hypothetical protein